MGGVPKEAIDGIGSIAKELVNKRQYLVANTDNCNPEAERAWGVIQRGIRTCHAHADAPECLWPWAAAQYSQVYHYLASTIHVPPYRRGASLILSSHLLT